MLGWFPGIDKDSYSSLVLRMRSSHWMDHCKHSKTEWLRMRLVVVENSKIYTLERALILLSKVRTLGKFATMHSSHLMIFMRTVGTGKVGCVK